MSVRLRWQMLGRRLEALLGEPAARRLVRRRGHWPSPQLLREEWQVRWPEENWATI